MGEWKPPQENVATENNIDYLSWVMCVPFRKAKTLPAPPEQENG